MAKLVYALNVSLDGYVDHDRFAPDPELFQHWIDDIGSPGAALYGRRMYEIMRYWDEEQPGWDAPERAYAEAWRRRAKFVVSTTLETVGPNATLIAGDVETVVRRLKDEVQGEIEVSGPVLAGALAGLIDEYRLYVHPVVLGQGAPFFTGPRPPLRLLAHERIAGDVVRLTYAPA